MDWHRLFGLLLVDYFINTPYDVILEKDLSIQQQLLDVVVVRKRAGELQRRLPDGFETFSSHNLITFKSYQETFNLWAMFELISHYVTYRKLVSPKPDELLPEDLFASTALVPVSPNSSRNRSTCKRSTLGCMNG